MKTTVRRTIALALGGVVVLLAYLVYTKGVRYMPPVFEPEPLARETNVSGVSARGVGAYIKTIENGVIRFRAYVPEPVVHISGSGMIKLVVENIHPRATLLTEADLIEQITGLQRSISGTTMGSAALSWRFPGRDSYRFTAIGDSGGGAELQWALQRSQQLGAAFMLHLGDYNYMPPDFRYATQALKAASIPTYSAIGNHDFYEGWRSVYPRFLMDFGPLNSTFVLGGVRFVNLDTATRIFPLSAGGRSALLTKLRGLDSPAVRDHVVFTHKPLRDPRSMDDPTLEHAVSGYEAEWLRRQLLALGMTTLIAGHVHMNAEFVHDGLRTLVTGAGLAHADLMLNKSIAQILVGEVSPGQAVRYRWAPLNMPAEAHCNPRGLEVLKVLGRDEDWRRANERCVDGLPRKTDR